jgi:dTDP-4-dehydrorhamnose reductase
MRPILLFGGSGKVGSELKKLIPGIGILIAPQHSEADFLEPDTIRSTILKQKPRIIINAAAYTDVDNAEKEPEIACQINTESAAQIAEAAKSIDALLIHYSSNYVFDGEKTEPYVETDRPSPVNTYGSTKLAAEQKIERINGAYIIIRTSWIYSSNKNCFLTTIMKNSRSASNMLVVNDQIANPTWARKLAELTVRLIDLNRNQSLNWWIQRKGIYHLAGNGGCSKFEWAKAILEQDQCKEKQIAKLIPMPTSQYPSTARRPLSAALNCEKFSAVFGLQLSPWQTALAEAMKELQNSRFKNES